MNKPINPDATLYNKEYARKKIFRQNMTLAGLGIASVGLLAYQIWLRCQSPSQIRESLTKELTTDPNLSQFQSQLENEDFMYRTTTQFTNLQLFCLTAVALFIFSLVKLYFEYDERDHQATRCADQISIDEYEEQRDVQTQNALVNMYRSKEHKEFTREKKRWMRAEEQLLNNREAVQTDNQSLNGLIQTDEDSDYMEREFEKIDRHINRVRNQLSRTATTASNLTTHTLPIQVPNSQLNETSQVSNNRQSMGPPIAANRASQNMSMKRQTSNLDGTQSDHSRRSSQANRR